MSNPIVVNIIRFVVLLLLQGLFLKRISDGWDGWFYVHVILYPLFILLLPLRTPRVAVLLLSFALGLGVDLFYGTLGIHTAATTFMGYARAYILNILEPREGYNVNYSPTAKRMGMAWFVRYAAVMMGLHLLAYYSVDAFSPVFILDILLKSAFSFLLSMALLIMATYIFNPQD